MKKYVDKFAHYIAKNQNLSKDNEEIIAYGMLAACQMVIIFLIAVILGVFLGAVLECICIYLAVGIMRKFTGGAHGSSMGQCILVSTLSIAFMAALSKFIIVPFLPKLWFDVFNAAVFVVAYVIIAIKAPVDSPNKPINNPVKIKRLRISAFIFTTIIFILTILLHIFGIKNSNELLLNLCSCLCLSVLWQTLTLTPVFKGFKQ